MEIRTILPQEVKDYKQAFAQLLADEPSRQHDVIDLLENMEQNSRDDIMSPEKQPSFVVALECNDLIGGGIAYSNPFRDDHNRFWVHTLYVKEACRNRGVGKALLKHMEIEAKAKNFGSIYLKTNAVNSQIPLFFSNQGYQSERVKIERYIDEKEIFPPAQESVRKVTPEFLKAHKDAFSELYLINDKAHILAESSTLEEAVEQMDLLITYLEKKQACVLCIDNDADICGVVWAYPSGAGSDRYMHFKQLTVKTEYRGKNLAQHLYYAVFKEMQKSNLRVTRTFVDTANYATARFHEKIGFLPIEYQLVKPLD